MLFQKKARLEVSGMRRGKAREIKARFEKKKTQTKRSDELRLRAYVAVVEFSTPTMAFAERG